MSVSDVLTIHKKIKKNIYWHLLRKLDMESHNYDVHLQGFFSFLAPGSCIY